MAGNMNKKVERIAEKRDNRPYATAKYIRISPYKVRTVLALIRGKSVEEAEAILTYCNKGGSEEVKKVLLSAGGKRRTQQGYGQGRFGGCRSVRKRRPPPQKDAARLQGTRQGHPQKNQPHHGHS